MEKITFNMKSIWKKTMKPWIVDDTDIPNFKSTLLELAEKFDHLDVLEWGAGGSTVFYPKFLKTQRVSYLWSSIEHDSEWADKVIVESIGLNIIVHISRLHKSGRICGNNASKIRYSWFPKSLNKKFHLIHVDGRIRSRCLKVAQHLLHPGGKIILHDAQRKYYHKALERFKGEFLSPHFWVGELKPMTDLTAEKNKPKKILITGCGRSGTGYMAKLCQALGLDVQHEEEGKDGTSDWRKTFLSTKKYDAKIHVVRHPLDCISSCQTISAVDSWQRIRRYLKLEPGTVLNHIMNYWYCWNLKAMDVCDETYQIERISCNDGNKYQYSFQRFCEKIGVVTSFEALESVPTNYNSRADKYKPLTWMDFLKEDEDLTNKILHLMGHFGYEIPNLDEEKVALSEVKTTAASAPLSIQKKLPRREKRGRRRTCKSPLPGDIIKPFAGQK